MLLQRLAEYAANIPTTPALYVYKPVRYIINLLPDGSLSNPIPDDTADKNVRGQKQGQPRLMPELSRSMNIQPLLLCDNAEYTLGLPREGSKPERTRECHQAYLTLLEGCWQQTNEPMVQAVLTFLQNDPVSKLVLPMDFDRKVNLTFRVQGSFVADEPSVQTFWARLHDPDARKDRPAPRMQCLICGQEKPVLARLQGKIKGIPNGNSAGTSLISANSDAFLSYGLEASLIAPTCAECGEKFTKGLNHLLADEQHHFVIGGTAFVWWTAKPADVSFMRLFNVPQPDQVKNLLKAYYSGKQVHYIDPTAFYAASFSGSNARAVVRDWLDTTVGEVYKQQARWFMLQQLVDSEGSDPLSGGVRPFGLRELAEATVRDPSKELKAPTMRLLLRSALKGTPLPWSLLQLLIKRNRAERTVTRPRAAFIKLILLSHDPRFQNETGQEQDNMISLNSDHPDAAYHCGRLLAILESTQSTAIPGVKASVVDRFYGTASANPATVFPYLLRNGRNHLSKLRRDRFGAYQRLQMTIEEIMQRIGDTFPGTLSLQRQGNFALGYYHQNAHDRAARLAATAAKRTASTAEASTEDDNEGIFNND